MVDYPYNKGDSIALKQQYVISDFLEETQKYWLFEAIQIPAQMTVMIKIYINDRFPSITEVEKAWNNEITILQSKAEFQNLPVEFIDSGTILVEEERLFIIVLNYVEESEKLAKTTEEKSKEFEEEQILPTTPSISVEEPEIILKEKQEIPPSARSSLKDEADYEFEDEITSKPLAPKTSESLPAPISQERKKKTAYSEKKDTHKEPGGISLVDEKDYQKHISMEYFDRMNPQNYYPLTLNIADIIQDKIAPIINPITGERKVQEQSQLDVKLKNPIVKIRPTLPGCIVVPQEIETDFNHATDEVTFYVTPVVKGEIIGHIEFINEGKVFHISEFTAKVVDPNYARVVAFFGILASFVPKILSSLGLDIGWTQTINSLTVSTVAIIGDMNIASLIAIGGIIPVIIASVFVRQRMKPSSTRVQYRIADFRLKTLKLPTIS